MKSDSRSSATHPPSSPPSKRPNTPAGKPSSKRERSPRTDGGHAMPSVTALRTIRIAERANLLWLEVETDDGLTGLGESFRGAQAVEAVIHEHVAPYLLHKDARQ